MDMCQCSCETVWSFAQGIVIQLLIWATNAPGARLELYKTINCWKKAQENF